jgi:hypothetical protein
LRRPNASNENLHYFHKFFRPAFPLTGALPVRHEDVPAPNGNKELETAWPSAAGPL